MISKRWLTITTILAFSFILLSTLHVAAQDRAVDLEVFIVEPTTDGHLQLFFETGSEDSTADFFFVRGTSESDPIFTSPSSNFAITVTYDGTPVQFITAQGNAGSGFTYDSYDEDVVDGQRYCYMIGEREFDSSVAYYLNDIRCATVGDLAFTSLAASNSVLSGEAGTTVTHTLFITNNGNRDQQFIITVPDKEWDTQVSSPIVFIPAGDSISSTVKVAIPANAMFGANDTGIVQITRQDNAGEPPDLPPYTLTTTVKTNVTGGYLIYLPLSLTAEAQEE